MNEDYIRSKFRSNTGNTSRYNQDSDIIEYKQVKSKIRDRVSILIDDYSKNKTYDSESYDNFVMEAIESYVSESPRVRGYISDNGVLETERLKSALIADFIKHGKIQPALDSDDISEIQINDFNSIWIEKNGVKEPYTDSTTGKRIVFADMEEYEHFVNGILLEDNKKLNENAPLIDAITKDGFRVAVQGSSATVADKSGNHMYKPINVTIRKQRQKNFSSKELVETGCMSNNMAKLLEIIPVAKLTTFIGGATSSGKTVILQVLADNCPDDMRIAALGNPAELKLRRRIEFGDETGVMRNNVVHLEAKEYTVSEKTPKEFPTIENCARANLRLTPDVIIYEEIRSKDEFEFTADAAQTGHFFLTSLHAKDVDGLLSRYVTQYIAATQGIDRDTAISILAEFLSLIIIRKKMPDNTRKISEIAEIVGTTYDEHGKLQFDVNMIYEFVRDKEVLDRNEQGSISRKSLKRKVHGRHKRVGKISTRLYKELIDSGFDDASIEFLTKPVSDSEVEVYEYTPLFYD